MKWIVKRRELFVYTFMFILSLSFLVDYLISIYMVN